MANRGQGKAAAAIDYLHHQIETKNPATLKELVTYLSKHQSEIINYQRRQQAGKPIGSGRVEKAVDARRGASPEEEGDELNSSSQALAVLKVAELNGQWREVFQMKTSAM